MRIAEHMLGRDQMVAETPARQALSCNHSLKGKLCYSKFGTIRVDTSITKQATECMQSEMA